MARLRLFRPHLSFIPHACNSFCLILTLGVVVAAIYRYCWLDAQDPFKCEALLKSGHWLDSTPSPYAKRPFQQWQAPGCLLHEYTGRDISECLPSRRILYVGDSSTRQIFWATIKKLDADAAEHDMTLAEKHSDLSYTRRDVTVDFLWDPFLNSTRLKDELIAYRDSQDSRTLVEEEQASRPAMIIIGGGLWYARYLQGNPQRPFREAIDSIVTFMRPATSVTRSLQTGGSPDFLLLLPVQVPWYESLSSERNETITPEKIDAMNEYLQQVSAVEGVNIANSYGRMTANQKLAYEEDGIHVVGNVAARKTDVLFNLRCNAHAVGYPHDRTCCSNYRHPGWTQWLVLLGGVCIIPALCWVMRRGMFRRPTGQFEREGWAESRRRVLRALLTFTLPVCMCYCADRTQVLNKIHKSYSTGDFVTLCGVVLVLGIASIRRSAARITSHVASRNQQSSSDQPFVSRDQTDEWKGWMQAMVLIYHYTGASKVLWIYHIVRLLVASYLFMTGFGHTVFFLKKGDYSLRRVAGVLVRLNLLSCVLPYLMRSDYLSYYFAPLVSFWFLVIYLTMRIGHSKNHLVQYSAAKIVLSAALIRFLFEIPGLLELIFSALHHICRINWDVAEWRFRVTLDIYIVYVGMLAAIVFVKLGPTPTTIPGETKSSCSRSLFLTVRSSAIILSALTIPTYLFVTQRFPDKYAYNQWHPWISPLPILAFVVLRNGAAGLRNFHSSIFAWLGRCSLETFTLQFHIWLAGDTKGMLSLGILDREDEPGGRGRWIEFLILTTVFLWVSWCVADATGTLTSWIVDGGVNKGRDGISPSGTVYAIGPNGIELPRVWGVVSTPDGEQYDESSTSTAATGLGKAAASWRKHLSVRLGTMLIVMWFLNMTYT